MSVSILQLTPLGAGRDVERMARVYPDEERREWIRRKMREWQQRQIDRGRVRAAADALQALSGAAGPAAASGGEIVDRRFGPIQIPFGDFAGFGGKK